mgnify:CR=1 FL=1
MKLDNASPITGLIIPSDNMPDIGLLRKNLLFFDSISLIDCTDDFLIHKGEVYDKSAEFMGELTFKNSTEKASIKAGEWNDTVRFPKSNTYIDDFKKIIDSPFKPVKKGLIGIVKTRSNRNINHVVNWHLYKSLTALPELLEAAAPDVNSPKILSIDDGIPRISNVIPPSSIFYTKSIFNAKVENLDDYWTKLAAQRIGRFVKAQHLAHIYQSCPVSIDLPNNQIAKAFHQIGSKEFFSSEDFQAVSVSLDVVDSLELVKILNDMTWPEFVSLRKAILPQAKKLRTYLINEIERAQLNKNSNIEQYSELMQKLKTEFEKRKEDYAGEWEKLRIATVLKLGGGAGSIGLAGGASMLPLPSSIEQTIAYALSLAALAPAAITAELKTYLPSRRRFKNHPLHFTEDLTTL